MKDDSTVDTRTISDLYRSCKFFTHFGCLPEKEAHAYGMWLAAAAFGPGNLDSG